MRILLVEDDITISRSIELMLGKASIFVETTAYGEECIELARLYDYDLILLDLGLPDMTGHQALRRLRASRVTTPVVILTGADDTDSKLKGFGAGADDYMTKPFQYEELAARIHAIVRRSKGHAQSAITTGEISLDIEKKQVTVNGELVHLTSKEYDILELLSLRKGHAIDKNTFMNYLYNGIDEPDIKIVDVFICKLRRKLSDASMGCGGYIETIWGRGYALKEPAAQLRIA